jgi:hypothetical protein
LLLIYLLNVFAVIVVSYRLIVNSWFLLVQCSISNVFSKLPRPFGDWEKLENLVAALEYGLLVHRNLLECRLDHITIILEGIKLRFLRHLQ